ncbi:hypothetical protein OPU71_19735 [Niveibacterium sp. 24ML]|uniref:transketolase family protein n=1 Tax=Niveibacterium sp. 24ML TaxID=2985512 RepID=UPI0022717EFF|nr:transketolase C-terminal domain-containing protein [Niveibacterium sp. 24ML]MCX9158359.1 hypothetical protein [Niveibacterium sp. 24ML]
MRNTFINSLCELARAHDDIFLMCGDLGYSVLEPFAEQFPERFLNAGIAEQNMTEMAVGLAREGYNVFTYSIGNFPTLRCMEQIRYDVCYHDANVKIIAVGGGYAYGALGVSHHTTEDIAMLRSIPNMLVTAPADPHEARSIAKYLVSHRGPAYVRLNKAGEPMIHRGEVDVQPGRLITVREGAGVAVLTTGAVLDGAIRQIDEAGRPWAVYSCPMLSAFDTETMCSLARRFDCIVTMEEHQLAGGFGSAVLECLSDLRAQGRIASMPIVRRVGIPNKFIGYAGTQEYLRMKAGVDLGRILENA